jgi:hypothetical protein
MDPITAAAVGAILVPLANGAAGEAGKQALARLVSYLGTRFGRGSDAEAAGRALASEPGQLDRARLLADLLEQTAAADERVAEWLNAWLQQAAPLAGQPFDAAPAVSNVIGDNARVSGGVVQAHTVSGPITFGSSTTTDGTA